MFRAQWCLRARLRRRAVTVPRIRVSGGGPGSAGLRDEVDYEESDDGDVPPGAVPDSDVLEGVPVDVAVPMNATLSVPSDEDDSLL